jgi:hypothetical protein
MKKYIVVSALVVVAVAAASGVASAAQVGNYLNGAYSLNIVTKTKTNTVNLGQTNVGFQAVTVSKNQNAGNNSSSFNTGGTSAVNGGGVGSLVNVTNGQNGNAAAVAGCGCASDLLGDTVGNSTNGVGSVNTVSVSHTNSTSVGQSNFGTQTVGVSENQNTGGNSTSFNTGGASIVTSGGVGSETNITNTQNTNEAVVGF